MTPAATAPAKPRRYRYTVCMDNASKLSGCSTQEFIGTSIALEDYALLMILQEPGNYININFARVRWYRCEVIREESELTDAA